MNDLKEIITLLKTIDESLKRMQNMSELREKYEALEAQPEITITKSMLSEVFEWAASNRWGVNVDECWKAFIAKKIKYDQTKD